MVSGVAGLWIASVVLVGLGASLRAQEFPGSIRGSITDQDFDVPLSGAQVTIAGTALKVLTTDQGNFVIPQVPAGAYTLVFSKDGYVRQVKPGVIVVAGKLTDVEIALAGEVTDLEEFVVQDMLNLAPGTETALRKMRFESPALMDSISSDLMSRAGASDAASALRLVAGASLQDGKSAVIRGLPDRYVSSQINGMRLPTADEDKRAVELDQFPTVVIEAIQVSKTFTPDQQGDASGGAVNVRLKGIPDDSLFFRFKSQTSFNSQVTGNDDFLSYDGGGVSFWGRDDGGRDIQDDRLGQDWEGAVGVSRIDAPIDHKWSMAIGGKHEIDEDFKIGGFLSLFYERDSAFFDKGRDDSWWVTVPGMPMSPRTTQGTPQQLDFKTALFDVTQARRSVQRGGLASIGFETKNHEVTIAYLNTLSTDDTATLAEDTRSKSYFFPGYDPNDPNTPGHEAPEAAPYVRFETLDYVERATDTLQLSGRHALPVEEFGKLGVMVFQAPEIDWTLALSSASLNQPDKRLFGTYWLPPVQAGPFSFPAQHLPFKPSANINLGNLQRIWKEIEEDSTQYSVNVKLPFEQWSGLKGYFKAGYFHDEVERLFNQDSFSNFNDTTLSYAGEFNQPWSAAFPSESPHFITESLFDVDYQGLQEVTAGYAMTDLPLASWLKVIGGARVETTGISIVNTPEANATWYPPGQVAPTQLNPLDGDAAFEQTDILPSIGFEVKPVDPVTIRLSYNSTIARQTFKELTPIIQQEYLGGSIFIGNPALGLSAIDNYDLRVDWTPYEGGLVSGSWFLKDIIDPIEYVQRVATSFNYTTAVNYPEGRLSGIELEVRQSLGHFVEALEDLTIGANATFIDSTVRLPDEEIAGLSQPNIMAPTKSRRMTSAPEHLFNFFLTYDLAATDTQLALFYTVQGDTLIAGAGEADGNYVPDVFAKEFDTLNLSVTQGIGEHLKLQLQAKNLTNPGIETVYRSKYIGDDILKTLTSRGIEFSISLGAEFKF